METRNIQLRNSVQLKVGAAKLNIGIVAGFLLLFSLAVPWTVIWGTNTTTLGTSDFYVFEFPFMSYYMVYSPLGTASWWQNYEFAPKYLGIILIVMGSILAIMGSTKQKRGVLVKWGGISSMLALIFFTGLDSADIRISYYLVQTYTMVPLGMFVPALFWLLILFYPKETTTPLRETPRLFCGQCGKEMSPEFNICPYCMANIMKPLCQVCGSEVLIEHTFCPFCGAKIVR